MNDDSLQLLVRTACSDERPSTPPDFRFTNYAFAPQKLDQKPLPQNGSSLVGSAVAVR
jgi:hypothetical protein